MRTPWPLSRGRRIKTITDHYTSRKALLNNWIFWSATHFCNTLHKWLTRYREQGEEGLRSLSRRPHHSPNRKVAEVDRATILRMRSERKGGRRIQSELRLYEQKELSLRTIHKVLHAAQ